MKLGLTGLIIAAAWAVPAVACYYGPMPVQFVGHTARLSPDDISAFEWQLDGRRVNFPRSRLLVIFYAPASKALLDQRQRAIQSYLRSRGLGAEGLSFAATTAKPSRVLLEEWTQGKIPTASVELMVGGCR